MRNSPKFVSLKIVSEMLKDLNWVWDVVHRVISMRIFPIVASSLCNSIRPFLQLFKFIFHKTASSSKFIIES
jgi:hypothetical protein